MLKKAAIIALFLTLAAPPAAFALTRGMPDALANALGPECEALAPCREIAVPGGTLYAVPSLKITLSGKGLAPASRTFPLTCYRLTRDLAGESFTFVNWIGKDAAPIRELLRDNAIPLPGAFGFSGEALAEEEIPSPNRLIHDWKGRFNADSANHWATLAELYACLNEISNAYHATQQAYMRAPRRLTVPADDAYLAALPYPNIQAALITRRTLNTRLAQGYIFQAELFQPQMILFEKGYHRGVLGFRKEAYRLPPYALESFTPDAIPATGHDLIGVNWANKFFLRCEVFPTLEGKCSVYQPNEKGVFDRTDVWEVTGKTTLAAIPSTLRELPSWKVFTDDYGITPEVPVWVFSEPNIFLLYPFPANAPHHTIAIILHAEADAFTVWPFFDLRHLPEDPGASSL